MIFHNEFKAIYDKKISLKDLVSLTIILHSEELLGVFITYHLFKIYLHFTKIERIHEIYF